MRNKLRMYIKETLLLVTLFCQWNRNLFVSSNWTSDYEFCETRWFEFLNEKQKWNKSCGNATAHDMSACCLAEKDYLLYRFKRYSEICLLEGKCGCDKVALHSIAKYSTSSSVNTSWSEPTNFTCAHKYILKRIKKPNITSPRDFMVGEHKIPYIYNLYGGKNVTCHVEVNVRFPDVQPIFIVREIGSSINFTCPDDLTTNNTYKFFVRKTSKTELIIPDERIKVFGPILMIVDLKWTDVKQYFCSIYNPIGSEISDSFLGVLILKPVTKYPFTPFTILPIVRASVVDEGTSFEFRCEYGKGWTQMEWLRLRTINGKKNEDYIPRNLITVLTDSSKSVEVYSIEKVTPEDTGTYRCEITEKNRKQVTEARVLQVKRAKPPLFQDMKPVFVVNKGDNLRIVLDVTGSPSPNISCYHNDRLKIFCSGKTIENVDLSQSNPKPACSKDDYDFTGYHELEIRFATFVGNDGMYRCKASNYVGNDVVNFRVNVTVSPNISHENSENFAQRRSHEQKIKCIINVSNPKPTVTWSQQDLPTLSSEADPDEDKWTVSNYTSTLVPTHEGGYDSILTIPMEKEESSFYRCFAQNNYGNDSKVFKLIRYEKISPPLLNSDSMGAESIVVMSMMFAITTSQLTELVLM